MTRCNRCGKLIGGTAEVCWWCHGDMCAECWDAYGHCGHPKAEEQNERARAVRQPKGHPDYEPEGEAGK